MNNQSDKLVIAGHEFTLSLIHISSLATADWLAELMQRAGLCHGSRSPAVFSQILEPVSQRFCFACTRILHELFTHFHHVSGARVAVQLSPVATATPHVARDVEKRESKTPAQWGKTHK